MKAPTWILFCVAGWPLWRDNRPACQPGSLQWYWQSALQFFSYVSQSVRTWQASIVMFVWGVRPGSRQAMPHTSPAIRLPPATMLTVAPVTSPIAAFAWSPSSPDPVTGMPVVLVAPGHGCHPVQTSLNQIYMDMLTFFIAHYICCRISHLLPNEIIPFYVYITPFLMLYRQKNDIYIWPKKVGSVI